MEIHSLTHVQFAPRDETIKLKRAIINPADAYKDKAESLHKYGQYLMSCLPKYVQQCVTPESSIWPCLTAS
jgi:hypothetical protein